MFAHAALSNHRICTVTPGSIRRSHITHTLNRRCHISLCQVSQGHKIRVKHGCLVTYVLRAICYICFDSNAHFHIFPKFRSTLVGSEKETFETQDFISKHVYLVSFVSGFKKFHFSYTRYLELPEK